MLAEQNQSMQLLIKKRLFLVSDVMNYCTGRTPEGFKNVFCCCFLDGSKLSG